MSSSSRMLWVIEEQEKEFFKQGEEMFNLLVAQNEMEDEEDEEHRRRDDEARSQRASHSHQVIQAVAQIYRLSHSANLDRSRQRRGTDLLDDYFVRNSAFPDTYFRRRSRMKQHLFNKIMIAVCNHDSYFVQKKDFFGVMGLLLEQKIIAALRMVAYGASTEQVDKIARMGKSTIQSNLSTLQSTFGNLLRWTCKGF
ncbi:uncharacterized protein [Pyrus communis]|uniref:uncharacterized protein n=1 Tax=Pyrus communis TaxID=23211 RepID=UPI0035BF7F4F